MVELTALPPRPLATEIGPGLIWGFRTGEQGTTTPITDAAMIAVEPTGWLWLHFNLADMRARNWLANSAFFPKAIVDILLSADDTQHLLATETGIAGVVFDVAHGFSRDSDEFGLLQFALDERVLVSGRRRPLNSVEAVRREIETGRRFASTTAILEAIVDQLSTGLDKFVGELASEVDSIEDSILGDLERDERKRLGRLRLTTVRIHRRTNGLRSAFRRTIGEQTTGLAAVMRASMTPLLQRLDEIDHDVLEVRDRARLLQEEITLKLAEQTNRHLHILSILTALLLPPALVAGLFGMNLHGMPFVGTQTGFWWALAAAAVSSGIAVWILDRAGVFRRRTH